MAQGVFGNFGADAGAFLRSGKSSGGLDKLTDTGGGFEDLKTGGEYLSPWVGGALLPLLPLLVVSILVGIKLVDLKDVGLELDLDLCFL